MLRPALPLAPRQRLDMPLHRRTRHSRRHRDDAVRPFARRLVVDQHVRLRQEPGEHALEAEFVRGAPRMWVPESLTP